MSILGEFERVTSELSFSPFDERKPVVEAFLAAHRGAALDEVLLSCIDRYWEEDAALLMDAGAGSGKPTQDAALNAALGKQLPALARRLMAAGATFPAEDAQWHRRQKNGPQGETLRPGTAPASSYPAARSVAAGAPAWSVFLNSA